MSKKSAGEQPERGALERSRSTAERIQVDTKGWHGERKIKKERIQSEITGALETEEPTTNPQKTEATAEQWPIIVLTRRFKTKRNKGNQPPWLQFTNEVPGLTPNSPYPALDLETPVSKQRICVANWIEGVPSGQEPPPRSEKKRQKLNSTLMERRLQYAINCVHYTPKSHQKGVNFKLRL